MKIIFIIPNVFAFKERLPIKNYMNIQRSLKFYVIKMYLPSKCTCLQSALASQELHGYSKIVEILYHQNAFAFKLYAKKETVQLPLKKCMKIFKDNFDFIQLC